MRVENENKKKKKIKGREKDNLGEKERLSLLQPLKAEEEQVDKSMT